MTERSTCYLLDTSIFIQAHRAYYSFPLCPGFWESLISFHRQGVVLSIDKVFDEICFGDEDALTGWAKTCAPKEFFAASDDSEVVSWFARVQTWANSESQYSAAAKAEFASVTDAWIVAYAGAKNLTVVTGEVFNPSVKRRIPIPNVCLAKCHQVKCIDVFEMLTRLRVRLVLEKNSNYDTT